MNLKKKLRKFFTLTRKPNAGFTLVELVVVIAILGILAGVGTVGYSGYVKNANKKADKVLVANIIRAVEVGNNSGAFVSDEVVQASANGVQFPIGIITLTKTPGSDTTSFNIGQVTKSTGTCSVPNTTYKVVTGETVRMYKGALSGTLYPESGFGHSTSIDVYQASAYQEFQYCEEHSSQESIDALLEANQAGLTRVNVIDGNGYITKSAILDPDGTIISGLAIGHTDGGEHAGNILVSGGSIQGGVLDNCLQAAYGPEYAGKMVLKSDSWIDPTLSITYDATKTMMGTARNLADILSAASGSDSVRNQFGISANYSNGASVIAKFSEYVADYPDAFIADWLLIDNGEIGYASSFGTFAHAATGQQAREIYSAARMAYNSSFGEYVKQNHGDANGAEHASKIANYYTESTTIPWVGTLGLPGTICEEAFTAEGTDLHADVKGCATCKDLYTKYVSSGASLEAAKGLVGMMTSMDEMESANPQAADQNAFYSYYTNYLNEFQSVFNSAKNDIQGKSAIVLLFYAEDGKITYDISPKSADPRTDS